MTRETRIGIALMLLLIGVFGAIFYKKWNDRQPTASVAAAAEAETEDKGDEGTPSGSSAPLAKHEPVANPFTADQNPFEAAEHAQPFIRGGPASGAAAAAMHAAGETAPAGQAEPVGVEGTESPLGAVETSVAGDTVTSEELPTDEAAGAGDPFAGEEELAGLEEPSVAGGDAGPFTPNVSEPPAEGVAVADADDPFATEPQGKETASAAQDQAFLQPDPPNFDGNDEVEKSLFADLPATGEAASGPSRAPETGTSLEATASASRESVSSAALAESPFEVASDERPSEGGTLEELSPALSAVPASVADDAGFPRELTFEESAEPAQPAVTLGRPESYTVQENDNYWSISKQVYGTPGYFQALAKFNAQRVPDPARLKPGMKVLIPPAEQLAVQFPRLAPGAPPDQRGGGAAKPGFHFDAQRKPAYRVGEDDTLSGIAHAHLGRASRWVQIFEMNRDVVQDAKTLKPGTVLRLPDDASRVRLVPAP